MLSIRCNSRIKSWKNWKTSRKNINITGKKEITHQEKMTRKFWEKWSNNYFSYVICWKKEYISCLHFKLKKTKSFFNDSKWRRMTFSCSKTLLRGITSKHDVGFYCLNGLHSFRMKNKLESHEKVCENKDFCGAVMPSRDTKILGVNQNWKSN